MQNVECCLPEAGTFHRNRAHCSKVPPSKGSRLFVAGRSSVCDALGDLDIDPRPVLIDERPPRQAPSAVPGRIARPYCGLLSKERCAPPICLLIGGWPACRGGPNCR